MATLDVSTEVHAQVRLLARALGTTEDGALRQLLEAYAAGETVSARGRCSCCASTDSAGETRDIRVHAVYQGERVEAIYDPGTNRVTITSGPLAGKAFKSPSGAAIAVVQQLHPEVNPNRNGWSFWVLTDDGRLLQAIRPRRTP